MPAKSPDSSNSFGHYLQRILYNDHEVLTDLYRSNYTITENFVLQNSGTSEEAKDIYQEAFIVLWRNIQLKKFVPENKAALSAYLFRVSKNKWINQLRSASKKYRLSLNPEQEEGLDDATTGEQEMFIQQMVANLQKLGDNCRELLKAFYFKKLKLSAIAAQFNWTEATAKNNKYRCLEKLRDLMKNQTKEK